MIAANVAASDDGAENRRFEGNPFTQFLGADFGEALSPRPMLLEQKDGVGAGLLADEHSFRDLPQLCVPSSKLLKKQAVWTDDEIPLQEIASL